MLFLNFILLFVVTDSKNDEAQSSATTDFILDVA
jgi:hypothetical protein